MENISSGAAPQSGPTFDEHELSIACEHAIITLFRWS